MEGDSMKNRSPSDRSLRIAQIMESLYGSASEMMLYFGVHGATAKELSCNFFVS